MKYADLVNRIQGKRALAWGIHRRALQAQDAGEDVIVLTVGDPEFPTPAPIVERAVEALRAGDTHYATQSGREPLRALIAEQHRARNGGDADVANVILLPGAQNALFAASLCLLEAGDEVIVPEPMYLTYEACVRATGATLVLVPVHRDRAFHLDCDAIAAAVTDKTRAIFFATPCNPTGVVVPREDLQRIADIATQHDLWVLSDEVYADLTFEPTHVSIASLPGMAERSITLGSLSKSYAMAGWRVGWAIGPQELIGHMGTLALAMLFGLPGFVQQAAMTALQQRESIVADMKAIYQTRRDLVFARIGQIPRLRCLLPEAGMFMLIDVSGTGLEPLAFTERLFEAEKVSLIDASTFGESARGFVRLGFVVDEARLEEACRRIERFVRSLP
ncbi:aminotransferase class I/II-fold pyridoxal phosphate-dependent enzyme [Pigmentiphaga aceris]|uniref:Aminotransferase n=1 Tax=Pigmentiphaga aceris TaxID=1940612 RepID=A0A5C0AT18_9BURK|nr:aminotransferase class I/II-fold pyridoxal phosphate-dependent enzyme [Pigmentiphaga aceris]QEI04756.1 aminotransferase class I/II-fold pyridoxal phosphate-dependent enzyme [Pigmentiphaga aceris]